VTTAENLGENDITDVTGDTFTTVKKRFGETVTIDIKPGGANIAFTKRKQEGLCCTVRCAWEPRFERSRTRIGAPVSHRPQLYSFPTLAHHHRVIPFASHRFSLLLHDHRLSPRPPAQDNCERIEDVPALLIPYRFLRLLSLLLNLRRRRSTLVATARP
jgi:hypothetical protein